MRDKGYCSETFRVLTAKTLKVERLVVEVEVEVELGGEVGVEVGGHLGQEGVGVLRGALTGQGDEGVGDEVGPVEGAGVGEGDADDVSEDVLDGDALGLDAKGDQFLDVVGGDWGVVWDWVFSVIW